MEGVKTTVLGLPEYNTGLGSTALQWPASTSKIIKQKSGAFVNLASCHYILFQADGTTAVAHLSTLRNL
jgi:hypothetical protein